MTDTLQLYLRYAGISARSQMQYRASFVMLSLGQLAITGIEFLGIWALFARFGSLRGWTLPEVALFYGIVHVAFAIAESFGRGFDLFPTMVKSGEFDRLLVRPRSTALQVAGLELHLMRVGRLLQGSVILWWAVTGLHVVWSLDRAAIVVASILGGACIFAGLFVLQATLAFWTIETLEIVNTVTYGGTETAQYPLTIYRPWFRAFFTFVVPLACMNYLPASYVLGGRLGMGVPAAMAWGAPVVGALFLVASLRAWHFGVRHYASTGS